LPPGLQLDLPPDRRAPAARSAGFTDRVVPRLALEREVLRRSSLRLFARGGAGFEASTRPQVSPWLDASRVELAGGLGAAYSPGAVSELRLDVHFRYTHFVGQKLLIVGSDSKRVVDGAALASGFDLRVNFH
jgi:hypothetical protein